MKPRHKEFVRKMKLVALSHTRMNKTQVENIALTFGIRDQNEAKELTELAIVYVARILANAPETVKSRYDKIVKLYDSQVNLSHRTSQSMLLQQYSTPAPIGFLAGIFCELYKLHNEGGFAFEPSAGNGLLTIVAGGHNIGKVYVNEVDPVRNANLKTQGFANVWDRDASKPFWDVANTFKAVISNPPFGKLDEPVMIGNTPIKVLDHLMAIYALDTMTYDGKAAIIIGGHTEWDSKYRVQAGKNRVFLSYLYQHYHVCDIINIDGKKLYSRQGTGFNVRLILIDGRKANPEGFLPLKSTKDTVVRTFDELYVRVMKHTDINDRKNPAFDLLELEAEALALELELLEGLGAPYIPSSSAISLDTVVPDSMDYEIHSALIRLKRAVGDVDEFVRKKLGYRGNIELHKALSAEQIDAVALSIHNIEAKSQGMIIGDQTGIGKGRIAAAMIRYGAQQGLQPIFLTEKANLFSDIYRDLAAIGSARLWPFIVNSKESKTDIKDVNGEVIYQAPPKSEQEKIFRDKKVPSKYNFVVATYSQFNSPETKPTKPIFLRDIANNNVVVMDESHNASGSSNTGEFLQSVLQRTKGVVFLSATFAKRPDNMPVYAMKTAMSEANMTKEELVQAITKGGVALQEILSSQLVAEGQMIRRERSFEGIEVNYISLDEKAQEHKAVADNITAVLRYIIKFQVDFIKKEVEELDKIIAAKGLEITERKGTSEAGVANSPYFSKVFNVINQMLFSIKADEVAQRAIQRLKEGKKPVIAFSSTMGSFIEQMENDRGMPVGDGDVIRADFAEVLKRGLDGVMRYTVTEANGEKRYERFDINTFPVEAQAEYFQILQKINDITTGITISPIDVIVQKLEKAGYSVAEVTGRKYEVQLNTKSGMGLVKSRKKINTNDAFRKFNNNEVDVLMINQSGSTGASAHAIVTDKVPAKEVRQRVMIVLQAELDINTEIQKRGRINRTGQILKPIYDYVNSAIPAEKRLMMMLQKKLKSLDANTSSNQKNSDAILSVEDFLNKYGDKVVAEYLGENPEVNDLLDDPLKLGEDDNAVIENAANKVSGRVAVLSTVMQEDFYMEISGRYRDLVEYLVQSGDYDLEVEAMDLQAETLSTEIFKLGKGGDSEFGGDSILEKVEANVLKKPFTRVELDNIIMENLGGKSVLDVQEALLQDYEVFSEKQVRDEIEAQVKKYKKWTDEVPNEKKIQKIEDGELKLNAIAERKDELEKAKLGAIARVERIWEGKTNYLKDIFGFFSISKSLHYPEGNYETGLINTKTVFLGFRIDRKKKNPYAPSAVKLDFALASPGKSISLPASYSKEIMAIKGASYNIPDDEAGYAYEKWDEYIKNNSKSRTIRYIITGNILQAFSNASGKLVSYTTMDGKTLKGVLMPDYWEPKENATVIVPVARARKIIVSLPSGQSMITDGKVGFIKQYDRYRIIVPASKVQGGKFFLNEEILDLVEGRNFNKVSSNMSAWLPDTNINALIDILQSKFSQSVELSKAQFNMIAGDIPERRVKEHIEIPLPIKNDELWLMEIEAEALGLELELLAI